MCAVLSKIESAGLLYRFYFVSHRMSHGLNSRKFPGKKTQRVYPLDWHELTAHEMNKPSLGPSSHHVVSAASSIRIADFLSSLEQYETRDNPSGCLDFPSLYWFLTNVAYSGSGHAWRIAGSPSATSIYVKCPSTLIYPYVIMCVIFPFFYSNLLQCNLSSEKSNIYLSGIR